MSTARLSAKALEIWGRVDECAVRKCLPRWLRGELEKFTCTLRSPDHTFIGARDAHLKYGLLQEDLDVLQGVRRGSSQHAELGTGSVL